MTELKIENGTGTYLSMLEDNKVLVNLQWALCVYSMCACPVHV